MVQNRNKLIVIFIGHVSNVAVHRILMKAAIEKEGLAEKYLKETRGSFVIALEYRRKINPTDRVLPDAFEVREEIARKVKSELMLRISRGYSGIELDSVGEAVNKVLRELGAA
jgi:hypothetical protein